MDLFTILLSSICLIGCSNSDSPSINQEPQIPKGKAIYMPKEFDGQDWNSDKFTYSYSRMGYSDDIVIFWEKGFGNDLSNPPQLEGKPMNVDLNNLKEKLERFYKCFRDTLQFVKDGSLSEKYRMMCMVRYSSEGTVYGGSYDDIIGALWVTPNRLQDPKLNVLAHELGHSFQSQISADHQGVAWGGSGFFEMASQWMLWYVNPDWITDENYHWEAFKKLTHKAFLDMENIYHSPYVLESWSEKHGLPFIAEMFRQGTEAEDPITTYKKMTGITWDEFNQEMFKNYQEFVNLDYTHSYSATRKWANSFAPFKSKMNSETNGWYQVKPEFCPENYGFNIIKLKTPKAGERVTVDFKGLTGENGYLSSPDSTSGWKYGFVGIKGDGTSVYGTMYQDKEGVAEFVTNDTLSDLWLVVMGAPNVYWKGFKAQWPYQIKIRGSEIL